MAEACPGAAAPYRRADRYRGQGRANMLDAGSTRRYLTLRRCSRLCNMWLALATGISPIGGGLHQITRRGRPPDPVSAQTMDNLTSTAEVKVMSWPTAVLAIALIHRQQLRLLLGRKGRLGPATIEHEESAKAPRDDAAELPKRDPFRYLTQPLALSAPTQGLL